MHLMQFLMLIIIMILRKNGLSQDSPFLLVVSHIYIYIYICHTRWCEQALKCYLIGPKALLELLWNYNQAQGPDLKPYKPWRKVPSLVTISVMKWGVPAGRVWQQCRPGCGRGDYYTIWLLTLVVTGTEKLFIPLKTISALLPTITIWVWFSGDYIYMKPNPWVYFKPQKQQGGSVRRYWHHATFL